MSLALIFRPKLMDIRSSFIFYYEIPRPKALKLEQRSGTPANATVELGLLEVKKGVTFVEAEVWKMVESHPANVSAITDMKNKGALSIHVPDAAEVVGSTSDFTNLSVVADIIRNSTDIDWISRSVTRDQRKEVFRAGRERIQELEEDRLIRQRGDSLELV